MIRILILLITILIFNCSSNQYDRYESPKFDDMFRKLENSYVLFKYDSLDVMFVYDKSLNEYNDDKTQYNYYFKAFINSNDQVVKYLLNFKNDKRKTNWLLGWNDSFYPPLVKSNIHELPLFSKNYAALVLIINYLFNTENNIKLPKESQNLDIDEVYLLVEKYVEYNDKEALNKLERFYRSFILLK